MADKFEQIRKLLDLADDARTPAHEADTARKMAERLMLRHAIDEEEVRQAAKAAGAIFETPDIERFNVYNSGNAFGWMLDGMFRDLVKHSRCRLATGGWDSDGTRYRYVVGFKSDRQFLGMLYTVVRLAFSSNVEPPYDPADYDGSVARMHLAGITWRDIARRTDTEWPDGLKLRRAWYRWADANGVERQDGIRRSPKVYRESFAEGFYDTIINRLWRLRYDAEREQMAETGERGALALRTRESVVEEFLYERFPDLRPPPPMTDEERKALAKRLADAPKPKGRQPRYTPPKRDEGAMRAGSKVAQRVNLGDTGGVTGSPRKEL